MARFAVVFSLFSDVRWNTSTRFGLERSADAFQIRPAQTPALKNLLRMVVLVLLVWAVAQIGLAQSVTGLPPFGSFARGQIDAVNLANANVHIQVPLLHKAGRGIPFDYAWSYDSTVWTPSGGKWVAAPNWGVAQYQPNSFRVHHLQDHYDVMQ